jgi:uncharacterized protein (DUF433 family)
MNISEHICVDPSLMLGKPTIRGTRITVELIRSCEALHLPTELRQRIDRDSILALLGN